jgi:catechol 2,3-dioxygenase-like lactoylglutathione lyase family enzyme
MKLRHVGLVYGSEENADRFLRDTLGLKKSESKTLSREMSKALFDRDAELRMVNYADESLQFEVFIDSRHPGRTGRIEHVCLEVDDLPDFLEKCRRRGFSISQIPKGDSLVIFIKDSDNNLFEIKGKKSGA